MCERFPKVCVYVFVYRCVRYMTIIPEIPFVQIILVESAKTVFAPDSCDLHKTPWWHECTHMYPRHWKE